MRFENRTIDERFRHAINKANLLLEVESPMLRDISQKHDWRFNTPKDGGKVAQKLNDIPKIPLKVFTFSTKPKVIGVFDNVDSMYFNVNLFHSINNEEAFPLLVGNLLHEYCHYLGFNHGTGWFRNFITQEKLQYSVNYYISSNIHKWI